MQIVPIKGQVPQKARCSISSRNIHQICDAFPALSDEDYIKLRDSIKRDGPQVPVLYWRDPDGVEWLIDGKHRLKACAELGITAPSKLLSGTEERAVRTAIGINDARRHLDDSQRAMLGGSLSRIFEEAALRRRQAGVQATLLPTGSEVEQPGRSAAKAAKVVLSSERQIARARRIIEESPAEVVAAVQAAEVSVRDAYEIRNEDAEAQARALALVRSGDAETMKQAIERDSHAGRAKKQPSEKQKILQHFGYVNRGLDALKIRHRRGKKGLTGGEMIQDLLEIIEAAR